MLLLRGATFASVADEPPGGFQYMLLLRGATSPRPSPAPPPIVSIHAPLARSNTTREIVHKYKNVSIHAPLARSNLMYIPSSVPHSPFQYMLLLRGATRFPRPRRSFPRFNTCSSCEEQLPVRLRIVVLQHVSIHAPLARSNSRTVEDLARSLSFQYMLLLRGATPIFRVVPF